MKYNDETQRQNREWRQTYRERKEKVLSDSKYFDKYYAAWNYRVSFHASASAILKAIPEDGALYRCSFWYNSFLPTRFMGSVVIPAISQSDAYVMAGSIASQTGSPLMTRISVKEVEARMLRRGKDEEARILDMVREEEKPDRFMWLYAQHLLAAFMNYSLDREEHNHLFLGSLVLHIPMTDDPCKQAGQLLDSLPLKKAHYKIESLGLFIERYCRNSLGPRYTALRAGRELQEFRFSLSSCQFCFDQNIQDRDFKAWVDWPSPVKSFQERYKFKNELVDFYAKLEEIDVFTDVDKKEKVAA